MALWSDGALAITEIASLLTVGSMHSAVAQGSLKSTFAVITNKKRLINVIFLSSFVEDSTISDSY